MLIDCVQEYADDEFRMLYGLDGQCWFGIAIASRAECGSGWLHAQVGPVGRGLQVESVSERRMLDPFDIQNLEELRFVCVTLAESVIWSHFGYLMDANCGSHIFLNTISVQKGGGWPRLQPYDRHIAHPSAVRGHPEHEPLYTWEEVYRFVLQTRDKTTRNSAASVFFGSGPPIFPGYPDDILNTLL